MFLPDPTKPGTPTRPLTIAVTWRVSAYFVLRACFEAPAPGAGKRFSRPQTRSTRGDFASLVLVVHDLGYSDLLHMLRLISAFRRLELENNTARQYSSRASIQRSRFQESGVKQTRKALITLESHVMPTREAQSAAVAACAFQLLQLSPVSAGTLSRQQRSDAAIGPLRFDISILGILSSRPCCDL